MFTGEFAAGEQEKRKSSQLQVCSRLSRSGTLLSSEIVHVAGVAVDTEQESKQNILVVGLIPKSIFLRNFRRYSKSRAGTNVKWKKKKK